MGKHPTLVLKVEFLTHLKYVHCAEAARLAGLKPTVAKDLKARAGALEAEYAEKGLPPPTVEQQIARKPGSRAKPKISV